VQGGGPSKNLLSRHPRGCPLQFDHLTEGKIMPLPSVLQNPSFKRLAQGAAVATMIIGFSWGGWSVESRASLKPALPCWEI
jgi:hypothetical protein